MDKETMIQILNQHGIDVLYDVISDDISLREQHAYEVGSEIGYKYGLSDGKHIGWCECFDMLEDED